MNRRDIVIGLPAAGLLSGLSLPSLAQGGPVEGQDYKKLDKPLAVAAGKIEVVEFFGYWCPHCNAFEPTLDAWQRRLPADQVAFRRVAISFRPNQETLQRLYYALEALGQVEALHRKVFHAYHVEHKPLNTDAEVAAWAQANGADGAKIVDAMKSFGVATKVRLARQLAEGYAIDGVPTLGVQGRWRTAPSIAGTEARALAVTDALIAMARRG
ncbi:thiol:disulfide interchange protein DsbA/DsbL [Aquabacterium sp. OR-4]|uniref:thiol:disulfide interchange protein DsbA/DsbL n=1 Tax=Aquabacterium sp. OR-4 TaxID=2978127 RepID=UPI0021B2695C|nr:thiol:disulfide interchange protein DsbA/DsbL [Aquabacterium sp. OR-4]MDT7833973.1 thiol:disulfide interchange protein DsbA/DsbL [Aquabacterium sp. OR-4]